MKTYINRHSEDPEFLIDARHASYPEGSLREEVEAFGNAADYHAALRGEEVVPESVRSLKVSSVEHIVLQDPVPVYDVTDVRTPYRCFALSNGVVVHNSGGMRFARFEHFQEFLPMKGKPKNLVGVKANRAQEASMEVLNILAMLGVDPKSEDPISNLRVGKLIVMADADPDGSHIQTLIFGILYKYVPEMFDRGMIYVTRVPEYYSIVGNQIYSGDSLEQVQDLLKQHKARGTVNHVKGYGEIDSKLLRLFACDPATRCLYQVRAKSFDRFELLMGNDTAPRKQLLGL